MFVQFNIYFVALTALLLSISFNYLLLFLSQKNMLKSINKKDENRLNKNNTPPFGGVAISLAFFITDPISSQLIKYLANTYLPLRLSFVNEATRLADYSGANLVDVLKGVGLDSRIGSHYFRPSPSWGGSCFPKDLVEVNNFYNKEELNLPLISNIIDSNNEHLNWTISQLLNLKKSKQFRINSSSRGCF
jgi:UDPglucose 6-dehydrogenase